MPIPENHLSVLARLAAQSVLPSARRLVAVSCLFQRGRLLIPSLCVYSQLLSFYPYGFVRGLPLCMENDHSGYKTSIFQRSTG